MNPSCLEAPTMRYATVFGPVNAAGGAYQRVSLSPHHMSDCSVLQGEASNGAALTVRDKQALPRLRRG